MKERILVIDCDSRFVRVMKKILRDSGYEPDNALTLKEAFLCLQRKKYVLILLSMLLPDGNGAVLCSKVKSSTNIPFIAVSKLDEKEMIIDALNNGAIDYLIAPIHQQETAIRIEICIKRSKIAAYQKLTVFRDFKSFSIYYERRTVYINLMGDDRSEVDLSYTEYMLLNMFIKNEGKLLLYRELYHGVWNTDSLDDVRTVKVHVSNLRKKLDIYNKGIITNVRRAGYIFSDV